MSTLAAVGQGVQLFGSFAFALLVAAAATPLAMRVAARTNFFDVPVGYKGHIRPTPYLGGAAVLAGFLVGAISFSPVLGDVLPIAAGAIVLWLVGTADDRISLSPYLRLAIEAIVAVVIWATGHGWSIVGIGSLDLILTVIWIVALVNAFNLMDNMDGAAGAVASISALGVAVLAIVDHHAALGSLGLALCGACLGFLPYNLRRPSRIFLGDGGSMPVGFIVAATVMAVVNSQQLGFPGLLAGAALVALPILDVSLVVISRRRRGLPLMSGGRDHVTHRLRERVKSARAVALLLAALQAVLCAAAIVAANLGSPSLVALSGVLLVLGASAIGMLETDLWAPPYAGVSATAEPVAAERAEPRAAWAEGGAPLVFALVAGLGAGLSPFAHSLYALSRWGPVALVCSTLLIAFAAAARERLSKPMLLALGSIAFLSVWALASSLWAESVDNAMLEAGRWLLYVTLLALLVLVVRTRRLAYAALGAFTAGAVIVLLYIAIRMAAGSGGSLFLGARLNGPLGYVNGQAAALLLAFWPLVAAAERARWATLRGLALGLAALVVGTVLLTQTRAIIPALALSTILIVAAVPGRERRLWALVAIGVAIGATAGPVLDVYAATGGGPPPAHVLAHAARALLIAAAAAGLAWGLATHLLTSAAGGAPATLRRASPVLLAVISLAAVSAALLAIGNPVHRVRDEVHAFVDLKTAGGSNSRFLSGGGYRYDYWRVAVKQFGAEPLHGSGAGNYATTYYRERRTTEDVRQAHSIELQVFGELGLVGGAALVLLLSVILVAFGRVARLASRDPGGIAAAVAAGGLFVTWLAHASVDWLNLLPGVTAGALIAAAVLLNASASERPPAGSRSVRIGIACAVVLALASVAITGRLTLADHYRASASNAVSRDPAAAVTHTADSLRLNDQSLAANYVQAAAYARLGDYPHARAALLRATRLEPHNFVTWALLGDLATRRGELRLAHSYYGRAHALNPLDPSLRAAAKG